MSGALRHRLADGRWHFQHGPIDCILLAEGDADAAEAAIERTWARFDGLLDELVGELALLRTDLSSSAGHRVAPRGATARRMVAACGPYADDGTFITAMAAVAGSVAETLLDAIAADPRIRRAWVNDGGDIALHLAAGESFEIGVVADVVGAVAALRTAGQRTAVSRLVPRFVDRDPTPLCGKSPPLDANPTLPDGAALPTDARFTIASTSAVRGIATSGWGGRSFSFGIADAVTVLAASASAADAAATIVANAVDVDDPRIVRRPANSLRDDSDLGERLVTCAVPELAPAAVDAALAAGAAVARTLIERERIVAALLVVQGRFCVVGGESGEIGWRRVVDAAPALCVEAGDRSGRRRVRTKCLRRAIAA